MLRLRNPQPDLWEGVLPEALLKLPDDLETVDRLLDDDRFMQPFLKRNLHRRGRPTIPMEQYLRLMVLKHKHGLGYETLVAEVADSIKWRRFCRIGMLDHVPHSTTLSRQTRRFGEETIRELNEALVAKLAESKLIRGRKVRTDTTVVQANVEHPTDAGLLEDGVGLLARTVDRVKELGRSLTEGFRNRTRTMKKQLWEIGRFLKKRAVAAGEAIEEAAEQALDTVKNAAGKAVEAVGTTVDKAAKAARQTAEAAKAALRKQVDALTARAAEAAQMTLKEAREVVRRLKRYIGRASGKARTKAVTLAGQLTQWIERTERALEQTRQRLAGVLSIPNRMVSMFDPDARPIRRGKLSAPVEFGYKAEMTQVEGKVISDYQVHIGNPNDATLAVGVVKRHIDRFGKPPNDLSTDRGYFSAENEKMLQEMGVKRLSMPARGKLSQKREEHQNQSWFRRLQRFRAGCEGSISFLKRCCGWDRSRLRGVQGVGIFAGFGVFTHNLGQAHVLTTARQRRRKNLTPHGQDPSGCPSSGRPHPPWSRSSRAHRGLHGGSAVVV